MAWGVIGNPRMEVLPEVQLLSFGNLLEYEFGGEVEAVAYP